MEMISVSSTDILAIGYDIETAILRVDFVKSGSYEYYGIPEEIYNQFLEASSKGKYHNEFIKKGGYSYSKI